MGALDTVSIATLLGSLLVLAGILSSLLAMRFGAPLLLVFLIIGMLAGESGPGGLHFNDVGTTYVVGSLALALILFTFFTHAERQNALLSETTLPRTLTFTRHHRRSI